MRVITSTLLLAGMALALPAPQDAPSDPTCTELSSRITDWTVSNFDFHANYIFTTPAHQNSWGYVNFTLGNEVIDYTASCEAASNWLSDFYYGSIVYNCTVPNAADRASFTFNRPTGELKINQTWNCFDQGAYYMAEGGIELDLDCDEEYWENPEWEQGQIYSTRYITCKPVTVDAPIEEIRGVA